MSVRVTIHNDEPASTDAQVSVTVVTVGDLEAAEQKHLLPAGGKVSVVVNAGQFVMVDEKDQEH